MYVSLQMCIFNQDGIPHVCPFLLVFSCQLRRSHQKKFEKMSKIAKSPKYEEFLIVMSMQFLIVATNYVGCSLLWQGKWQACLFATFKETFHQTILCMQQHLFGKYLEFSPLPERGGWCKSIYQFHLKRWQSGASYTSPMHTQAEQCKKICKKIVKNQNQNFQWTCIIRASVISRTTLRKLVTRSRFKKVPPLGGDISAKGMHRDFDLALLARVLALLTASKKLKNFGIHVFGLIAE